MRNFCAALLFLTAVAGGSSAAEVVERENLVKAAYTAMPALLRYVEQLKQFDQFMPENEQKAFRKISELARKGTVFLEFSDDRTSFNLHPGEPERLMRSTAIQDTDTGENLDDGKIYVNRALLNAPPLSADLPTLLKLLFHEFGHKTTGHTLGARDRMAQVFENQIAPYIKQTVVGPDSELIVLSLPTDKIDQEIGIALPNEPQPSYLVLLNHQGRYIDLTDHITSRMERSTISLRSMWAEANQAIFQIIRQVGPLMTGVMQHMVEVLKPMMHAFGLDTDNMDTSAIDKGMPMPKEIRNLEIHDSTSSSIKNGIFISLRSTYSIGRTDKENFTINVEGFPFHSKYPVPTTIHIFVPTDLQNPEDIRVDVQVRPNADYMTVAKVGSVIRREGSVRQFKVRLKTEEEIKNLSLIAHYGMGHLTVQAAQIEKLESGGVEGTFEINPSFYVPDVAFAADSLLINGNKMVFLDRMVTLSNDNDSSDFMLNKENSNDFLWDTIGIWGRTSKEKSFQRHFTFKEPVWILDGLTNPRFVLDHSYLKVEFKLRHEQKIREARLHVKRHIFRLETDPKVKDKPDQDKVEKHEILTTELDGKQVPFTNGGQLKDQADVFDIAIRDSSEIYSAYLADGTQKVQTTFSIPFRTPGELATPTEAYGPPIGYPYLLEVVTDSLETLHYYFEDPRENCETILATAKYL